VRDERFLLWTAVALLVAVVPLEIALLAGVFPIDFLAFWCAGKAVAAHQNPYLEGALHDCELAGGLVRTLTVPVPYPPYYMPLFAAFAALPMRWSFSIWCAASVAAAASSAFALRRITGLRWHFLAAAVAAAVLVPSLPFGQLAPVAFCCFAWALAFTKARRPRETALALTGVAMLPNFAAASWVSTWACVRGARRWMIVAAAALTLVAIAATGPQVARSYITQVLPAHGRSEIAGYWQIGLTAVVHALGLPPWQTLAIAYAAFALLFCAGLAVGFELRDRFGGDHWVVASATAFGVAGAPFAHGHDLGFALPLAVMLFAAVPGFASAVLVLLLATPWQNLIEFGGVQALAAYPFLLIVAATVTRVRLLPTTAIVATIAALTLVLLRFSQRGTMPLDVANRLPSVSVPADALAEVRWTRYNDALDTSRIWYERVPIYCGLVLLIAVSVREARRTKRPSY